MAKPEESTEDGAPEIDADGLPLLRYSASVLVIVPPEAFDEQGLRHLRSALENVHVATRCVSSRSEDMVLGVLQDEFLVDGSAADETLDNYVAVVLVGGTSAESMASDPDVLRLVRLAFEADKLVGAWGRSVSVLARAGLLEKRRVAGDPAIADEIRAAGGRYSPRPVQVDGQLITGSDESAGMRFAKAFSGAVPLSTGS
jgi:protease I